MLGVKREIAAAVITVITMGGIVGGLFMAYRDTFYGPDDPALLESLRTGMGVQIGNGRMHRIIDQEAGIVCETFYNHQNVLVDAECLPVIDTYFRD